MYLQHKLFLDQFFSHYYSSFDRNLGENGKLKAKPKKFFLRQTIIKIKTFFLIPWYCQCQSKFWFSERCFWVRELSWLRCICTQGLFVWWLEKAFSIVSPINEREEKVENIHSLSPYLSWRSHRKPI